MPAQHKRPGRKAREERCKRARARQVNVKVVVFQRPKPAMIGPGRVVAIGEVV